MSSAKSYLVKNRHYDFCSLQVLQSILLLGAKFVELDIFNSGFNENESYPIVTNGYDKGEWKTCVNKLSFEECCQTILKYGIQYWQQNWTNADPIFLYLNCHSLKPETQRKMAEILYRVFENTHLLPIKYCNGGKSDKSNVALVMNEPPESFYNRVIIVTNLEKTKQSPRFSEMVNMEYPEFNPLTFEKAYQTQHFIPNKQMTMVYDNSPGNELVNYNPIIPWVKKANFVAMHFQNNDSNMTQYLKMFSLQYPEDNNKEKRKFYVVNTSYRLMEK